MMEEGKRKGKAGQERKQVLEGNAFYEIDLTCVREKKRRESTEEKQKIKRK